MEPVGRVEFLASWLPTSAPSGPTLSRGFSDGAGISFAGLALAVALALFLFVLGLDWAAGSVLVWAIALLMVIGARELKLRRSTRRLN